MKTVLFTSPFDWVLVWLSLKLWFWCISLRNSVKHDCGYALGLPIYLWPKDSGQTGWLDPSSYSPNWSALERRSWGPAHTPPPECSESRRSCPDSRRLLQQWGVLPGHSNRWSTSPGALRNERLEVSVLFFTPVFPSFRVAPGYQPDIPVWTGLARVAQGNSGSLRSCSGSPSCIIPCFLAKD